MKLQLQQISIILVVLAVIFGCDAPPCEYSDEIYAKVGFSKFDDISIKDTSFSKMTVLFLDNELTSFDTLYNEDALSGLELPLSQTNDTSRFLLQFDSVTSDVISVLHRSEVVIESHECGFILFYDLDSVWTTNNIIDSVKILRDKVNYADAENLKIYF